MGSKLEEVERKPVLVVLDVETTGLKPDDKIVQIACLKIDTNGDKTAWMRFINPNMDNERQQDAYRIHKISPEFLSTKPNFEDVCSSFLDFLQDVDVVACHNALFDWSMLSYEFKRIGKSDDFKEKFQWLDIWRLAVLFMPNLPSHSLNALKSFFHIYTNSSLSNEVDCGGDTYRQGDHDAMYDVLTTYEVLKRCMETMDFAELLKKYPKALLDTSLFIDIQRLRDEKRTTDEDLRPLAVRAKRYYTAVRPKGGVLGELSKDFLSRMTRYHKDDHRTDRRVVLIYEAALLDPIPDPETPSKAEAHNKIDVSPCRRKLELQHLDKGDAANLNLQEEPAKEQSSNMATPHKIQSETMHSKEVTKSNVEKATNEDNDIEKAEKKATNEGSDVTKDEKTSTTDILCIEEGIIAKANSDDFTDSRIFVENNKDSQEIHLDGKGKGNMEVEQESSSSPKKMKVE